MSKDIYKQRRRKLIEKIKEDSLIVLFAGEEIFRSEDQAYPFTVNRNFNYLTGINSENIIYLAIKKDGKVEERLYVEKSNPLMEKWVGTKLSKEEATNLSGVEIVDYTENFRASFNKLISNDKYKKLYIDMQRKAWDEIDSFSLKFAKEINSRYPFLQIENLYYSIAKLRYIKDDFEIRKIKKAIEITNDGIVQIMKNMSSNVKEYELEAHYDFILKKNGVKPSFKTIAAAGKNATILHYISNDSMVDQDELVLFDLGVEYENYCSDISRTLPASGKFTERQVELYNIVLNAQLETIKAIKPNKTLSEINDITKKHLAKGLKEIGLINEDSELSKYYYHGVSHMLGLDTHDVCESGLKLKQGMVITVEPGIYVEEESIGIRIEDDVLVTKDGCLNLSAKIIKTVEEIENFMATK